jgi:NAD(P)-dependent dehydrogenase (short-subunit alcohol dehydrogenase family)
LAARPKRSKTPPGSCATGATTSSRTLADVTDAGAVAALAARLRREFGRVDILVNNAGVFLERKDFAQPQAGSVLVVDPEMVAATYACNALAPLRLIQAHRAADARKQLRAHRQRLVGDGAAVRHGRFLAWLPHVESGAQCA